MKTLRIFMLLLLFCGSSFAQKVIQVDIQSLLNARVVTTLSDNKLIPWPNPVLGGGSGMATQAAVLSTGDKTSIALPDDGVFAADAFHPKVVLNYSNARASGFQVRCSQGEDLYTIRTPKSKYEKVFLFCMSGGGISNIKLQMNYSDNTSATTEFNVPDWASELKPTDINFCYLAKNMGKWDKTNKLMEADHHYLIGAILRPNPAKKLTSVVVNKGKKAVLTLWGVTLQGVSKKK